LEKSERDIQNALEKLGNNNPIKSLVELSTKFSKAKLLEVIDKLGTILEAIQKGKEEDETNEQDSKIKFEALMREIDQLYTAK